MTTPLTCTICGRAFRTDLFARLHAETFHAPAPSPEVQQFSRMLLDERLNAMRASSEPQAHRLEAQS